MDDKELFNKTSFECSKIITKNYSSSFTLSIKLLDRKYHEPIYGIYGFVRSADEIVDTFLQNDRKHFLDKFKKDANEAIQNKLSFNPVLHAFQQVVNKYNIEQELIEAFFISMEMDINFNTYDCSKYNEYIYGSAEVVGLMCLRVFCVGDDLLYKKLKESACKLGSAFQKVNFLRDIKSDYEKRGRIYFPGVNYEQFDQASKVLIEEDIKEDFEKAIPGINQLPDGARSGVQMAFFLYKKLFEKIRSLPPEVITQQRVRVSKFVLMMSDNFFYFWLNILIISIPFMASFESRINYCSKWKALFPAIFLTASFFIPWDIYFTRNKIWSFNPRYFLGIKAGGIPVEEWMFFFTVPYSCVFIHESSKYFFLQDIFYPVAKPFFCSIIFLLTVVGFCFYDTINTRINCIVGIGMIIAHYYIFGDRLLGRVLFSLLLHYIPFFICNGLLTGGCGMMEPVVYYNEHAKTKYRIGTIPVEDIVYSMSLLLMNITIFECLLNIYAQVA